MAEIRYFIMTQTDDFKHYKAIDFEKIDVDFLMAKGDIQKSLTVLQDTTRIKLGFYSRIENASDQLITELSGKVNGLTVDEVDEFQFQNARLNKALADHFDELPKAILSANQKQEIALTELNTSLSAYGLSIYNINLTDGENVFYYHRFQIKNQSYEGIFELNKKTLEVSSFKEI
ncbi:hypothetical protein BFP71_05290 [Roseivirga misakiensis]|uniref:Uncharacterized protein n=2 Tax=Roseivirga misakiensis TaxID=1563681 RepID=A0A1E5T6T6_9BACT|nr:hypothetical protein BFP71_05290 [Roseivirga misakiensis]